MNIKILKFTVRIYQEGRIAGLFFLCSSGSPTELLDSFASLESDINQNCG